MHRSGQTLAKDEPIAVVGSGCRFPGGASTPAKLWNLLSQPRDVLTQIPPSRFCSDGFYHEDGEYGGHSNVRDSYLLSEDYTTWDAGFFNIAAGEAGAIDPQQRLLMECVFEALEAGGHSIHGLRGSDTAVYVGLVCEEYSDLHYRELNTIPRYFPTGTARSIASNRISYFFDWRGPSMTIDTACSSSLVAVNQAVQTLRSGVSKVAVAAGVQLILGPEPYIVESAFHMLSPSGRCRMWDASADGYGRGDGVAAVVLKTLSQAVADGDRIECVIREIGVNQDGGATSGITVPNPDAQIALIQDTYRRAGLDLTLESDRPHFFECHGTGTPTGDPLEAKAICESIGRHVNQSIDDNARPLYVGSIKTVIGHTEATAGIAGLLKASLAVQEGLIPPNLLFEELNPAIRPFYTGLQVPVGETIPWPATGGQPRRVSVNSFGFGGTNAHAIVESYHPMQMSPKMKGEVNQEYENRPLPFTFSSGTKLALKRMLKDFGDFLSEQVLAEELEAHDLAFTLNSRRSVFPCRAVFSARGIKNLGEQIRSAVSTSEWEPTAVVSDTQQKESMPRILGVFAGQGAQWAGMAKHIVQDIPFVSQRLAELDGFLASLPDKADRPSWSLREELSKVEGSRLHLAQFAQPVCTALQIVQVDLLAEANVHFCAVVGHSSGEMAAAYAAGLLSARDAIIVAYYRGLYSSQLASNGEENGPNEKRGAMMAVGMTIKDAQQLLSAQQCQGRVALAAHNSQTSVTLSGDQDAILEIKEILAADGKFVRLLRVDQAYHSHHMQPCLAPYVEALGRAGVGAVAMPSTSNDKLRCKSKPTWYSSVFGPATGQQIMTKVDTEYWARNMGGTVLFADAVEVAVRTETSSVPGRSLSMAVGVGPHGALRGPLEEIFAAMSTADGNEGSSSNSALKIPYVDVLTRHQDDSLSLMQAIGQIWAQHAVGMAATERVEVDLGRFQTRIYGLESQKRRLIPPKNLPTYPWDHTRTFWHESRRSRALRTRSKPAHPLLGTLSPESVPTDFSWHNLLRVTDLPWLRGHRLQGQIIYPAACYMAAAIHAALHVVESRQRRVKKIELKDMWIGKAIVFEDETASGGVEVYTNLNVNDGRHRDNVKIDLSGNDVVNAQFRFRSSVLGAKSTDAPLNASGSIIITLFDEIDEEERERPEAESEPLLSSQKDAPALLVEVGDDHFYSELSDLGYHYTESFRSLSSPRRKLGYAQAALTVPGLEDMHPSEKNLLLHPGPLDALFQAIFLAYAWPGDGRLWSMHVPVAVDRLQIDIEQVRRANRNATHYMIEAEVTTDPSVSGLPQEGLGGDVGIFTADGIRGLVLAEGVRLAPLATASANEDVHMFLETVQGVAFPDCTLAMTSPEDGTVDRATEAEKNLGWLLERIAHFYLARLAQEITPQEEAQAEWHHQKLMNFARHAAREVASNRQPYAKSEWAQDTHEMIIRLMDEHMDRIDVQLMRSVGEHLPAAVRNETIILQHMVQDGMLNRSYEETLGVKPYSDILAAVIEQIVLIHPNASILEIGAGTGGATKRILNRIPHAFDHYTFTDISSGFFEAAESIFSTHVDSGRLTFRTLDIERNPIAEQGFEEHSHDIVLASFVLHATADLENTLRNARLLLKPGGYLVLLEMTSNDTMRLSLTMGGLEGWWLGAETGRPWSPCVSTVEWHQLLKRAGFTGVEQSTPELDPLARPFGVLVSRALDDRVKLLLEPSIRPPTELSSIPELLIIAGSSLPSTRLTERVCTILQPFSPAPIVVVAGGLKGFMHDQLQRKDEAGSKSEGPKKHLAVLYLADLDERPLLEGIEPDAFEGLKLLFSLSPDQVLWVTHGAQHGERPYAVASVGLGRALMMEYSHISIQFLDFAVPEPDAKTLADDLLRLRILYALDQQQGSGDGKAAAGLLWSREPEVSVDKVGRRCISRIVPHLQFNEVYNSARRSILAAVDPAQDRIEMYDGFDEDTGLPNSRVVLRTPRVEWHDVNEHSIIQIRPRYTVPLAVQAGGRTWNLSVGFTAAPLPGTKNDSRGAAVVLCDRLGSIVTPVSEDSIVPWDWDPLLGDDATPSCLAAVSNAFVASLVAREAEIHCRSTYNGSKSDRGTTATTLLLVEPDASLAREVSKTATASDSWRVISLTSSPEKRSSAPDVFTFIDANAGRRAIQNCLGLGVSPASRIGTIVISSDPATNNQAGHVLAKFLQSAFPEMAMASMKLIGDLLEDAYYQTTELSQKQNASSPLDLATLFSDAMASIGRQSVQISSTNKNQDGQDRLFRREVNIVSPRDYAERPRTTPSGTAAVIDWSSNSDTPLTATARPLDSIRPMLRGDRTYLLLGLGGKGGLGSSLAEYMVRQGARHIILTSRNPGVDTRLIEAYAKQGVRIRGFANDVTHEASVRKMVQDLRDSPDWPPIAGVANGAMVLADVSLQNMTYDQMVRVLRPKIDGSILVDKIFHSDPLDFFILFSSLSCVLGNRGQANYDAANMFLVGLAAQRRARGVVASVVDIGAIMGMGYMAREVKEQTLKQMVGAGFNKMSERDFFMAFAHGILAGCSSSSNSSGYEVITGLHVPPPSDEFQPGWVTNPRFSHMVARSRVAARQQTSKPSSTEQAESTRDLLKRSRTRADLSRVVTAALLKKMTHMLQLSGEVAGDHDALLMKGTSSLGVDSLVAVEIRSWMLREFEVDMPVFKILADTTIRDMVEFILASLPANVIPCFDKNSNDDAIVAASTAEPQTRDEGISKSKESPSQSLSSAMQRNEVLEVPTDPGANSPSYSTDASSRTRIATSASSTSQASLESPPDKEPAHARKMDSRVPESTLNTVNDAPGPPSGPEIQKTFPMSYGQSRFWLMSELGPGPTACNVVNDIEIRAELNKTSLAGAVRSLGARHEALRTAFVKSPSPTMKEADGGYPEQAILKDSTLELEIIESGSLSDVDELFQKLHSADYSLQTGELMRMILVSVSPNVHHLLIGYHHINMDSFSMAILMGELLRLYDGQTLPTLSIQQADLALHERRQLQGGQWAKQIAFWNEQLATKTSSSFYEPLPILPVSPSSSVRSRPERIAYSAHSHRTRLSNTTAQLVRSLCRSAGVTPFHLYTVVFQLLLARLANIDRVIIGMADGNRGSLDLPGATGAVGNFLNIVPLPLDTPPGDERIHRVLQKMKAKVLQAMSNSAVPFEIILDQARAPRSTSYSPLFQAFIDYKKVTESLPMPHGRGEIEGKRYLLSKTPYDLMIDIIDTPTGDALVELRAQESLYTSDEAMKLLRLYVNLLNSISQGDSQTTIDEADMFDAHEVDTALQLGQGEVFALEDESILPHLDATAEALQSASALEDSTGGSLSWSELTLKSKALAQTLHVRLGEVQGLRVGLFQEPTVDWIVTMLGIWRAGVSYVPLDLSQGMERLAKISKDAGLSAIVVHDSTLSSVGKLLLESDMAVVNVSALSLGNSFSDPIIDPGASSNVKGRDEAMVLFTSGTTGEPKGISIPHRVVVNGVEGMLRRWPELAANPQTVLQQVSLSFDLSWWTVLLGLSTRGKVVVASRDIRGDPRALTRLILKHEITLTVATPSETVAWLQSDDDSVELRESSWRWHIAGGEPFSLALLRQLHLHSNPSLRVINAFGPAEGWMPLSLEILYQQARTIEEVEKLWPVPLGTVMPNYTVRIVDDGGRILPSDMPGQLIIGGAGVARGYINQPKLTAQRFPRDRYSVSAHLARGWDKAHLSGDYGYVSAKDGVFVLLGRIKDDTQVKLRGLRVDLRDVEASIIAQARGRIKEVVATVREVDDTPPPSLSTNDSTARILVAHAVLTPSPNENGSAVYKIADFLNAVVRNLPLPDYMRPTVIIPVETLPLTPNGKLDRRAIAAWPIQMGSKRTSSDMVDKKSDLSLERIKQIWLQILGSSLTEMRFNALDPDADFFHMGGNSILLTRVQNQLRRQYGVDVALRELFHSSTLGQMASLLEKKMPEASLHGVDWEQETQPPPELALAVQVTKLSPITSEKQDVAAGQIGLVVALTGATGFLGHHIARQLVDHPGVAEVHCVAVRSSDFQLLPENQGSARATSTKLVIHHGDLSQPDLGITDPAELESLFACADVIIHNGADTSFLKSYPTLRPTNLDSLKTLMRLSLTHRTITPPLHEPRRRPAHMHFVSTAGVATFLGRDLGEESLGRLPPAHVTEGYLLTKWIGEMFVERAVAASEGLLRATVHRPTALTGPGAPELDVVSSVMRYSEILGSVPALEGYAGKIQFVPVEKVAEDVVNAAISVDIAAATAATVQYRNHCGEPDGAADLDRLGEFLQKRLDQSGPIPVLEDRDWIIKAEEIGFPKLLGEYLRADTLGGKRKTFRILLKRPSLSN